MMKHRHMKITHLSAVVHAHPVQVPELHVGLVAAGHIESVISTDITTLLLIGKLRVHLLQCTLKSEE